MKIETAIDQAAAAGFKGIELAIARQGELTPHTTAERCAEIRAYAGQAGVRIVGVASVEYWNLSLTDPDPDVRAEALTFVKDALRITAELQAEVLLVIPGYVRADFIPHSRPVAYDFAYATAVQQIRAAAQTAEALGVQIGIENVWNQFLWSPLEFVRFLDDCASPSVRAYFDVANCVAHGVSADWVRILGKRIVRVHFKEYKKTHMADGTMTWAGFPQGFDHPLGAGDVDYPSVLAALAECEYQGPVTYEYLSTEDGESELPRLAREMRHVLTAGAAQ